MGARLQCSGIRYAVIKVSSNKDMPERLVIPYQDENCLRDLIAAPSLLWLGFSSREEAMANLKGLTADAGSSEQGRRIRAMFHTTHFSGEFAGGAGLKQRRILNRILQSALAELSALFYSNNLVSVMIRVALGASF